jgi:cytochrome P450
MIFGCLYFSLGLNFAQVEMQVFLVMLLQKFRVEDANHVPEPRGNLLVWQIENLLLNIVPL